MKVLFTILIVLTSLTSFSQETNYCDTVYINPQTPAQYANGTKGLIDYLNKKLMPIVNNCLKKDDGIIQSMHIKLIIDMTGKVIAVDFPKLKANESCKEKLRNKILKTMRGWTAGQMDGKYVCSQFYWRIKVA